VSGDAPGRRGPVPRIDRPRAPRNQWGLPDYDAIYREIQDAKIEAREQQAKILEGLTEILRRLPKPPGSP
jgi:hypothetical protein